MPSFLRTPMRNLTALTMLIVFAPGYVPLDAQVRLREIHGTVHDEQHEPLRGAIVQLKEEETGAILTFLSEPNGNFVFHHLRDGEYILSVTFRGHHSHPMRISKFDNDAERNFDIQIKLF